jgi:choline dehydrogenase-like flavoprotein
LPGSPVRVVESIVRRAVVVGSGAGGATAAKELQGHFQVTVLKAGHEFRPLAAPLARLEHLKRGGLLRDERAIALLFRAMRVRKTRDGMVLVNGVGPGGTTTIATGNALRADADLRANGIDLDDEFRSARAEIPIGTAHQDGWRASTVRLFEVCDAMGLHPQPTPKLGGGARCRHCGRCVLGCPWGAKWDSRAFLDVARERGAEVVTGCRATGLDIRHGKAVGVHARQGARGRFFPADLIVVAAGGLATPAILEASGIDCEPRLFVDPVLCVAGEAPGCRQCFEIDMPFVVQRDGYMLSPYFDLLSFFFNPAWRYPAQDIVAVMVKIADSSCGRVTRRGVEKSLSPADRRRLAHGVAEGREILTRFGVTANRTVLGTLNAGHPGGTLPLTEREAETLHHDRLPRNVFVADATLLPRSTGQPPILTIVALAKRVAKSCIAAAA